MIWIVILMAFLGGMVQGITGFGGGIVMMMVFPMVFPLTQAAGLNGAILVFLNATMVYVYRKHIKIKMVLPVFLFSIIVSSITIKVAAGASPIIVKKLFGGFLLLLSVYYLFIKKDGRRQTFDKSKLLGSMIKACEKRSVSLGTLEEIANEIEQALQNKMEREVSSTEIGEMVMDRLKEVDGVAYVRFASVYRQFKDINTFMTELNKLLAEK